MPRRKNRERRHVWLRRELEASGYRLNDGALRRPSPPPTIATTAYADVVLRSRDRRRPPAKPQEAISLN